MANHHIIDRRTNQKGKSIPNRRRFLRRVREHVKRAAREAIRGGNIKDITSNKKRKINIPSKDLEEHHIVHGKGGDSERVFPGNEDYITGDRIRRPGGGGGAGGKGASKDGEMEDQFSFNLTKDEFLDIFFEDLELPDLVKENIKVTEKWDFTRAGYVTEGTPARLNILRSMRSAKGRRKALVGPKKKKLKELEEELETLNKFIAKAQANGEDCSIEKDRRVVVEEEIKKLKRKIRAVPFVDDVDLRYNHWQRNPQPTTQAVMFCIMDVSGSMGEWEKEMAKRFFMLLYLFLTRSYERVELVFIRHHHQAKEVEEEEFFHSRESGGTLVSPALEMMCDIVEARYDLNSWNVYACQASDGDNWPNDTEAAKDVLESRLLRMVQYYAYVEIDQYGGRDSDLWDTYNEVKTRNSNFDMTIINDASDIYPVFRRLFEKGKGTK
jgi:uncharacterized sporulation protein YeaH/YhbH (DUF444 family)